MCLIICWVCLILCFHFIGVKNDPELRGVIPNSFEHIFQHISRSENQQYLIRASYLEIYQVINEPPHGKTNNLHRRKTKTQISFAVTAKLISAFVFATRIVQFLFYLNIRNFKLLHVGLFCACTGLFVSDLFGNHIVGFPTRRLI